MSRFPTSALKVAVFALVTFVVIGLLGTIIANTSFHSTTEYSALFTDATAVEGGETVRLAGVPVGTVSRVEIVEHGDARLARVDFAVDAAVPVFAEAQLQLRYENVIGRRYLAILERPGAGTALPPGATIPADRTVPALDLTVLFNGFQPLFQALEPGEVNTLSQEIIQTLQGEGGTLRELMAHTARLTSTLGDRDAVIGRVVDNLTTVLTTVDQRDTRLTGLIDQFAQLMRGLADQRGALDSGIPAIAALLDAGTPLLAQARAPLRKDVDALGSLAGQLADTGAVLDQKLRVLPDKLAAGSRLASYGSWLNFYFCRLDARVSLLGEGIQLGTPADVSANERDTVCGLGQPR